MLTVADIDRTIEFYEHVLGMTAVTFGAGRQALTFGSQKINLHRVGHEIDPKAHSPMPGSADLCLITSADIAEVHDHLQKMGVTIEEGPVERTGALGPITSIYLRDPDLNLIEVSVYPSNDS